ncbi:hypothetical protein D0N87_20240 [Pseudomonas sp. ATCC 13867]|nr:hypothetical protein D0N87_20240 [Pseudomonas sp. ATCC 13867]
MHGGPRWRGAPGVFALRRSELARERSSASPLLGGFASKLAPTGSGQVLIRPHAPRESPAAR